VNVSRKPHSPRFVRLSSADVAALFGGEVLEPRFPISNGRFVARQRVAIVGHKGRIDGVPVVGPPGETTSISFSDGDAERLALDARGVLLVGSHGELKVLSA
jgi:propanediol utilization protein